MPPAILADSDDEGDEIVAFDCGDEVSSSRGNKLPAMGGYDGTDDRSTGSTGRVALLSLSDNYTHHAERLRRQIQSAERGLLSNTAPETRLQPTSSASPSTKRRHTSAFASEGNAVQGRQPKRTKTLKTYGASKRQIEQPDNGDFDQFRRDDVMTESQAVRFSDHSGQQSSVPLPTGSFQAGFVNHEPAMMFKDTGDTIADASSEQQRLLEQAIASNKSLERPSLNQAEPISEQHSSSIPWTVSEIANSARSKKADQAADEANVDTKAHLEDESATVSRIVDYLVQQHPASLQTDKADHAVHRPQGSPIVEIMVGKSDRPVEQEAERAPKPTKVRTRKVEQQFSEPLNSDDQAIGLPREKYVPRPSRRRATQIIEDPIDYSVRPEKAAKAKRTKTTGTSTAAEGQVDGVLVPQSKAGESAETSKATSEKAHKPCNGNATDPKDSKQEDPELPNSSARKSSAKRKRSIKADYTEGAETEVLPDCQLGSQSLDHNKLKPATQQEEDEIFVKPAIPTPKSKSSSKAKRAQTTIFEDHVEFLGSQRSPSLSQQQAKRKSALKDVKNESDPPSSRKRKSVVAADSDDEDELVKDDNVEPPKKRGKGRPAKAKGKAPARSAKKAADLSDEDEEEAAASEVDEKEQPKKRGRGRPPKPAAGSAIEEAADADSEIAKGLADPEAAKITPPKETEQQLEQAVVPDPASQPASTPSKSKSLAPEMPTGSPVKAVDKQSKASPQKPSPSDQHSPIKKMSTAHRVGLSKKHRIPSLLRTVKPAKK